MVAKVAKCNSYSIMSNDIPRYCLVTRFVMISLQVFILFLVSNVNIVSSGNIFAFATLGSLPMVRYLW